MPAVRIGRLAVDRRYQGIGLGKALLADAALKTMTAAPASFALLDWVRLRHLIQQRPLRATDAVDGIDDHQRF